MKFKASAGRNTAEKTNVLIKLVFSFIRYTVEIDV